MDKKKIKTLILSICLLLLLGAAYMSVTLLMEKQEEDKSKQKEKNDENAIVLSIAPEQISQLSFGIENDTVVFEQKENIWSVSGDPAFSMNEAKIKLLTKDLAAVKSVRQIDEAENLDQYGLGKGCKEISVIEKDGKEYTIRLGSRNKTTNQLYFQLNHDEKTVYLTETALDQHFSGEIKDFAVYEEFPQLKPSAIRLIEVNKEEESYKLTMPGDDKCVVEDTMGNIQQADLNLVGILQNNLSYISWIENLEYNCQDFSTYGIDNPQAKISIDYEQDSKTEQLIITVGNLGEKGYYVRLNDSPQVHAVRKEYLEKLIECSATSFWSLSYSFISIGDIEYLDVTAQGETHRLQRIAEGTSEDQIRWYVDGQEVDKEPFTNFYYACASVTAQERIEMTSEISAAEALKLEYKMLDGTFTVVTYYEYDQNFYTVVYENGTKAAHTNKIYVNEMLNYLQQLLTNSKE